MPAAVCFFVYYFGALSLSPSDLWRLFCLSFTFDMYTYGKLKKN